MWYYTYSDELYHHGVKGQKWGKRRYQNKDGTLTPAGKQRYSGSMDGSAREAYKKAKAKTANARARAKSEWSAYDRAYREAGKLKNAFGSRAKAANSELERTAINYEYANQKLKAAKRAERAAKKMAKIEAKEVKKAYREQYMKGESALGKVWAKLTDGDRIYADYMYSQNKGKYIEQDRSKM